MSLANIIVLYMLKIYIFMLFYISYTRHDPIGFLNVIICYQVNKISIEIIKIIKKTKHKCYLILATGVEITNVFKGWEIQESRQAPR